MNHGFSAGSVGKRQAYSNRSDYQVLQTFYIFHQSLLRLVFFINPFLHVRAAAHSRVQSEKHENNRDLVQ